MTVSPRRYLVLDIQGRNTAIKPGETTVVERDLILRNRSDRPMPVDLWIEPNDAKAMPLRQWCQFSNANPTLNPGQEQRVQLRFEIPSQAEPGFYSYDVCAQTPESLGEVERRSQQLEVLTSNQAIALRNEPAFYLDPPTSSEQPYSVKAGSPFTLQVTVENRSKRVDRLFLTCPELPADWFGVEYPEATADAPGRITQTEGLQLNPDASGTIRLTLHPPHLTPAGHYSTTLRLTSTNQDNLVLLDILYFTVQVNDQLKLALDPKVGHVPGTDSEFGLTVHNMGNVRRALRVDARDGDRLFRYRISPNPVELAPGEMAQLLLQPTVQKWWRRQWKQRQEVPFQVEVINTAAVADEADVAALPLLNVPKLLDGKIIWESYPKWLRWLLMGLRLLLIALLIAGLLAGATLLAYWLIKKLVIEPSLEPKVLEFSTPSEGYTAEDENPIQLDWEVSHADQLSSLGLTFFSRETNAELPLLLDESWIDAQDACKEDVRPVRPLLRLLYRIYGHDAETNVLICQGVQIRPSELVLAQPSDFEFGTGAYDVTLMVFTSDLAQDAAQASLPDTSPVNQLPVSAAIAPTNPEDLNQSDTRTLRNIQITPADPPEILYFYSKAPTYREPAADQVTSPPADAEASDFPASSSPTTADISAQYPDAPVALTWIIDRPWEIEALELSSIAITSGGTVQSDRLTYPMENNLPIGLEDQCRLEESRLICEDVPTAAETSGEYTFNLTVVMPAEQERDEIAQEAEPIQVRPPFPKILSFTINGKQAADHPQQVHLINPARGSIDAMLEWEVENPDQVQVELLPAPGLVAPGTTQMSYAISPTPGSTSLTLQVTNEAGETVSRSVMIATVAPSSTSQPILPVPLSPPGGIPLPPPPPDVLQPVELEPIQVPPSGN